MKVLAVWLLACIGAPLAAQTPCAVAELLPERAVYVDLGRAACVLEDAARSLDLTDVLASDIAAQFEPVATGLVDFGFGASRYWVRAKLRNAGAREGTWWITHDMPISDALRVRLVRADGTVEVLLELDRDDPFSARTIQHRHLVSEISLDPGEEAELVIDYITGLGTQMPLFAESVDQFVDRTQTEMVNHLLIIALVLGMGAISTLYFYSLEGPPGLIYGAYVLSAAAFLFNAESYGFQFLYPNATEFFRNAFPIFGLLALAFGTWFIGRLTRVQDASRLLSASVTISVTLVLFLVVTGPVFISFAWYKIGSLLAAVFGTIVQVVVIASALRQRQSGAWLLMVAFLVTGMAVAFTVAGYLTEGLFPQEQAGSAMRLAFFLEGIAYSGAIALRIREARRARDRSLRDQLRLSQEALRLSEAVQKAEAERRDAQAEARQSRVALSSAAHDIRQPLTSLQMLLREGRDVSADISGSLSYIEDILSKGMAPEPLGTGLADPVSHGTKERFALNIVLRNVEAMFGRDAEQNGISLRVVPCSAHVVVDPLSLMRMTSNLVSNALKHAGARGIVVGCRREARGLAVEVHDNGRGMTPQALAALSRRGAKGAGSDGHGLGLAIANDLAQQQNMRFDLRSEPGRGTVGRIFIATESDTP